MAKGENTPYAHHYEAPSIESASTIAQELIKVISQTKLKKYGKEIGQERGRDLFNYKIRDSFSWLKNYTTVGADDEHAVPPIAPTVATHSNSHGISPNSAVLMYVPSDRGGMKDDRLSVVMGREIIHSPELGTNQFDNAKFKGTLPLPLNLSITALPAIFI